MKRLMITLLMIVTLGTVSIAGEKEMEPKVLEAFKYQFADAEEIEWTMTGEYYKARFKFEGKWMFAFYNANAEWIANGRYISFCELSDHLQKGLKKNYSSYWIAELFEITSSEGTGFYIALQNADKKFSLESLNNSNWSFYKDLTKS